jgi:hypothetical protein
MVLVDTTISKISQMQKKKCFQSRRETTREEKGDCGEER